MVVAIALGDRDAFAQILVSPEVCVFDLFKHAGDDPTEDELQAAPVLCRIWVMHSAIKSGRWPKVGMMPLRPELTKEVPRFKRNPIGGHLSIYINCIDRPASRLACAGLEPAAVWSAEQVEARLRDHLAGRKHRPLEQLLEGIPR
jgi:hypothetical protein